MEALLGSARLMGLPSASFRPMRWTKRARLSVRRLSAWANASAGVSNTTRASRDWLDLVHGRDGHPTSLPWAADHTGNRGVA